MSTLQISEMPVSADPALAPLWDQIAALLERVDLQLYGHTDLCDRGAMLQKSYQMQIDNNKVGLVARDGVDGPVIGYARTSMPLADNRDLAEVGLWVDPDHEHRGVGTRLLGEIEQVARDAGRSRMTGWTGHRDEATTDSDPDAVPAPTGVGQLLRTDPVVRFALAHGYVLEQTERHSQMPVPVPADVLTPLREKALSGSHGYRVITWIGATPAEHVASMVVLHQRMSTDAPMGALDFEEEAWDPERVRRMEANEIELGFRGLQASAQDIATGELVAYTRLVTVADKPEVAYQEDTLVRSDHRGHRLGLLVKIANADALAADRPDVRRVHTWNAGENEWMLAINVALGFRRASTEGAWQKKLL